jgi:glycosyltransferase involved in cell wall biosynthesis
MLDQPDASISRAQSFYEYYVSKQQEESGNSHLIRRIQNKLAYQSGVSQEARYNKQRLFENRLLAQKARHLEVFTFSSSPYYIQEHPLYAKADIIHLHWVSDHYVDYQKFFANNTKPVVWTLHDMNAFTGGCHYSEGCTGYKSDCSNCPQLQGTENPDYAATELNVKRRALQKQTTLTIVSPSQWLLEKSEESKLFNKYPHLCIPYGISSSNFQPRDKYFSRELLNIPADKKVILFVAYSIHSVRKGYTYLIDALKKLYLEDNVALCAIGAKRTNGTGKEKFYELGSFTDERLMSMAYSAADVFVIPSLEDNLPNTVIESLLCGTPVIGFPTGGIKEMIQDGENGYLCEEISVAALADKLQKFLDNPLLFSGEKIRKDAVEKYDASVQANKYITLYQQLLNSSDEHNQEKQWK